MMSYFRIRTVDMRAKLWDKIGLFILIISTKFYEIRKLYRVNGKRPKNCEFENMWNGMVEVYYNVSSHII